MTRQSHDWERLARYVVQRREIELGWTQEKVRAEGGPSTATQRLIEKAGQDSYSGRSLSNLERALGWASGSVREILTGGQPTVVYVPESTGPARESASPNAGSGQLDPSTEAILQETEDDLAEVRERLSRMSPDQVKGLLAGLRASGLGEPDDGSEDSRDAAS